MTTLGTETVETIMVPEQAAQQGHSRDELVSRESSDCCRSAGQQPSAAAAGSASSTQARETPLKQKSDETTTSREMIRMSDRCINKGYRFSGTSSREIVEGTIMQGM